MHNGALRDIKYVTAEYVRYGSCQLRIFSIFFFLSSVAVILGNNLFSLVQVGLFSGAFIVLLIAMILSAVFHTYTSTGSSKCVNSNLIGPDTIAQ